jgi:peroxiredoxin
VDASSRRTFENNADHAGPRVGDIAPGFDLRRSFEESVSLKDLISHGPVLLLFYVFDFGHV